MLGTKITYRYLSVFKTGKAAFDQSRSRSVKTCGFVRSEDSGVSNKKKSENLFGLKGKVSCATFIDTGLVGPKMRPNWTPSIGQKVNILLLTATGLERGIGSRERTVVLWEIQSFGES